ncbi:DMT family transporter [Demequina sp. B12]|uniref:EamA family transporter n=1 Tax=Demequina sp. B12 TaxID=2992757 RepID=UPI00237A4D96|nr:DMT family transporter [Demequina sp. B12]MDE0572618.1 DMT family transporter [Demequina sp. B12]
MSSSRLASGLGFALLSAAAFGMSGSLGRGLMDMGWTAGSATLVRVAIAAAVLTLPGIVALRGRWHLVRRGIGSIVAYGIFAVAGAQLCYFFAVQHLDVSVALLIEYLAPIAVVLWMWMRHGSRPTRLTLAGAALAFGGLVLLLDVLGGGEVSLVGIGWALCAMVGASVYFVISGDERNGLPPLTLAAGALLVALVILSIAALTGVLPMAFAAGTVEFASFVAPWWAVVLMLGVVTAGVSYVAGIAAVRRLGARLGSFVALTEVLAAALFAWLLLAQVPGPMQLGGALLVLAGVIVVKLGEKRIEPVRTPDDALEPQERAERPVEVPAVPGSAGVPAPVTLLPGDLGSATR